VPLGTTFVGHERARLFRLFASCQYSSRLRFGKIEIAELADTFGMAFCFLGFSRISPVR
jgi:hypothetical protein